ncbi:MAG: hypothetical protein Q8O87_03940 [bacterium]|nr:hypothetical protein [bacterium]
MAYRTLNGTELDLNAMSLEQKRTIAGVFAMYKRLYQQGGRIEDFINFMYSDEVLPVVGAELRESRYWVTEETRRVVAFQLIEDLHFRLAIKLGSMLDDTREQIDIARDDAEMHLALEESIVI